MKILVTGASGYIGSHVVVKLLEAGYKVIGLDNSSNSSIYRLEDNLINFFGRDFVRRNYDFWPYDLDEIEQIEQAEFLDIDGCIHLAASKSVVESQAFPLKYYKNNVASTISLVEQLLYRKIKNIVFSSSACVYGENPTKEDWEYLSASNPYGHSKIMCEQIIKDSGLKYSILRYFNPIGAHHSLLFGDNPKDRWNKNVMGHILNSIGNKPFEIFGNTYRDFIDINDLARGHVDALVYLITTEKSDIFNLGTGRSVGILELYQRFCLTNLVVPDFVHGEERPGDIIHSCANVDKAKNILGFKTRATLEESCQTAWKFHQKITENQTKL